MRYRTSTPKAEQSQVQHEDITKAEEYVRFFVRALLKRSRDSACRLGVFGNGRRRALPFHFPQLARPAALAGRAHTRARVSCSRPASSSICSLQGERPSPDKQFGNALTKSASLCQASASRSRTEWCSCARRCAVAVAAITMAGTPGWSASQSKTSKLLISGSRHRDDAFGTCIGTITRDQLDLRRSWMKDDDASCDDAHRDRAARSLQVRARHVLHLGPGARRQGRRRRLRHWHGRPGHVDRPGTTRSYVWTRCARRHLVHRMAGANHCPTPDGDGRGGPSDQRPRARFRLPGGEHGCVLRLVGSVGVRQCRGSVSCG